MTGTFSRKVRGEFTGTRKTEAWRWMWPVLLLLVWSADAAAQASGNQKAGPADALVTRSEHTYFTPDVVLRDADGKTVALRPLTEVNQPVMLDFIYTSCTAVCPLLTETFAQVERELGADAAKLRMISISVDPEYDTPKVLRAYAQTYHAGPQWRFLTGNSKDIVEVEQAFDAYRANKMDHAAIVLLRASPGQPWIRFDGLVSPSALVREYRAMHP
jgi:protein SCO1/2